MSDAIELVGTLVFMTLAVFIVGTGVNLAIDSFIAADLAHHPVRAVQMAQLTQERLW